MQTDGAVDEAIETSLLIEFNTSGSLSPLWCVQFASCRINFLVERSIRLSFSSTLCLFASTHILLGCAGLASG